jgi:uncharacterized membrane-anchored protein
MALRASVIAPAESAGLRGRRLLSRVPEITALFWVVKVLTTGMGEATSDYLVHRLYAPIAVVLGALGFAVAMWLQLRMRRYVAWAYWFAVVMVAVFGTMVADVLHVGLHVPYAVSTPLFAVSLAVVFVLWYRSEGTLSIHSIRSRRREVFYWLTVMATFALGTAAGDLTAKTLGLGWLASGVLFAVAIAVPALGYWRVGLDSVVAFWAAYIVTRPLGASFADWLGLPHDLGGIGLGRGTVSLGGTVMIVALVAYLARTRIDVADRRVTRATPDAPPPEANLALDEG